MPTARSAGATGLLVELIPAPSAQRDELLLLVRLGVKFQQQHGGRGRGFLFKTIKESARRVGPPYRFEQVLEDLESAAIRRSRESEAASPIEKVDRVWELLTYHDPRKGRMQRTFKHARNLLTDCKKILEDQIPDFP